MFVNVKEVCSSSRVVCTSTCMYVINEVFFSKMLSVTCACTSMKNEGLAGFTNVCIDYIAEHVSPRIAGRWVCKEHGGTGTV